MSEKNRRIFEHFPPDSICPICNTGEDRPCFLLEIHGTGDGSISEAQPAHVDCMDNALNRLIIHKVLKIIYLWVGDGHE